MALLKNNRRRTCQHIFRDPLSDDAVFTRLELLQKHNFKKWLEIELIKSDNVNKQV